MTERKRLRPVPHETLTDIPQADAIADAFAEGFQEYILRWQQRHIDLTPGHQADGCRTCRNCDLAIAQIGGGNEG